MYKYLFFLLSAISISWNALAQTTMQSLSFIAAEQKILNKGQIVHQIPLSNNITPKVQLADVVTEEVSTLPEGVSPSNSFSPDIVVMTERKKPVAVLQIPLFRRLNGKTERLVSYTINLEESSLATHTGQKPTFVNNSVLASGTWYKIAVRQRGIHKIDRAFIQSMGLNPAEIDPNKIRIYGNGGTVMEERVSDDQADDLIENAIWVKAAGNSFGTNDYVLFYANGPRLWTANTASQTFEHSNNYYADSSYYFISFNQPGSAKHIETIAANTAADLEINTFNDYAAIDVDSYSVSHIGKVWWSHRMNSSGSSSLTQNLNINLGAHTGPIQMEVYVGNTSDAGNNNMRLSINGEFVKNMALGATSQYSLVAVHQTNFEYTSSTNNLNIQLKYEPAGTGIAYLDYIRCNYLRPLSFGSGQMNFRAFESLTANEAGYNLQGVNSNTSVWEITNPLEPIAITGSTNGGSLQFTRPGDVLREFVAFDYTQFNTPAYVGTVANQNLHALPPTNYLIITNKDLLPAAEELADFHRQLDQKHVTVVTVDKIYNEFSSGGQDIAGIRNFIKMFYDRSTGQNMIKNVLLLGAASYDYKNRISENTNVVPTFQTYNSLGNLSFSSDDFFALLDEGESINNNNLLDIGIGRIPAFNLAEAFVVIGKIKNYASAQSFGPWKNVVSYVADDKDKGGIAAMNHLDDCEDVNTYFENENRLYNLHKIYADAYQIVATASGGRYPDVNKSINDGIYNGTFLMSYSGHGSPKRWADEAILSEDDYNTWNNMDKLPIMVTATCDFGRYDDPHERSAGAKLLMRANGGAIAMITTTQIVYASQNTALNQAYTQSQFSPDAQGEYLSLGEALTSAKNSISIGLNNNKKYVILGDPALQPQFPKHKVKTEALLLLQDGEELPADTIKALGHYLLKGKITNKDGALLSDFNGSVFVSIFDKQRTVETVNPSPGTTPTFNIQNNTIAKVRGTVEGGLFAVEFVAPKDLNYDYGLGKISYYAHNDQTDANGIDTQMTIGGFNELAIADNEGPKVEPFIDDELFEEGGVTGPNPLLYVKLFDENGINVSGSSVGHDLIAILDNNVQEPYVMNNYYQSTENNYQSGYVRFPLSNLTDGLHTIKVRAWDVYNNSGEGSVSFTVSSKDKGVISSLYNYPNPVYEQTHIVFQHNQENEAMTVRLQFFSQDGRLVNTLVKEIKPTSNRTEIIWDGKGQNGIQLSKGIYFYRIELETEKGIKATAYQKLVLLR